MHPFAVMPLLLVMAFVGWLLWDGWSSGAVCSAEVARGAGALALVVSTASIAAPAFVVDGDVDVVELFELEMAGCVAAVVCAGLYPNVAHAVKGPHNTPPTLFDKNMERVYFHNSSVNHKKVLEGEWVAFHEKFATSRVFLSSTSIVNPFSLLLFGGSIVINHLERKAIIDDRIVLNMAAQTGVMFRELRHKLTMLLDEIIEVINVDSKHDTLIDGIVKLLSCE